MIRLLERLAMNASDEEYPMRENCLQPSDAQVELSARALRDSGWQHGPLKSKRCVYGRHVGDVRVHGLIRQIQLQTEAGNKEKLCKR